MYVLCMYSYRQMHAVCFELPHHRSAHARSLNNVSGVGLHQPAPAPNGGLGKKLMRALHGLCNKGCLMLCRKKAECKIRLVS